MRILVTGGTGLIGQPLVRELAADGHEVIVLSRSPEKKRDLVPGAQIVGWDAETAEGWGHLADGADAIVNLAGTNLAGKGFPPKRWTPKRKESILQSRLKAGHAVVEAVEGAAQKPGVVVQASAIGYYGPSGDEILLESSPPGDDFLARVCIAWEETTTPVEEMGVRRAVTRTGFVLSDKGGGFPTLLIPFKLFAGGPMGNGEQWVSWIHIEDEVRAIQYLIENQDASGVYNLTAPNPVRNRTLANVIGAVMGRPSFVPVPGPALRLALGEVAVTVLNGQRAVPEHLRAERFDFKYTEVEQAVKDLLGQQGAI
jgi:uncharacterized protein (TIGR01777 family)